MRHDEHNPWPVWLIVTVGAASTIVAVVLAVIWTGSQYDSHGSRLIDAPMATVLAAVLGIVGTLLALIFRTSGIVRHEVKNSHGANLRDDIDDIKEMVGGVASDIRGMRKDHGRLVSRVDYTIQRLDKLVDHVDELEDTIVPRKDKP